MISQKRLNKRIKLFKRANPISSTKEQKIQIKNQLKIVKKPIFLTANYIRSKFQGTINKYKYDLF